MNKQDACPIVRDLMPTYIDGLTEPNTSAFIERHLTMCESCRKVRREMLHIVLPEERAQSEFLEALRQARLRHRRRIIFTICSLLLIAAICLLPFPRMINTSAQALRWRANTPNEETYPMQVTMKGIYLDFLLLSDRFWGDISIEGHSITQAPGAMLSVRIDNSERYGHLIYKQADQPLHTLGFIVTAPDMREFVIGIHEENRWSGDGGLILTYPAINREEAVTATHRILAEQNCTWLSESNWEGGVH